MIMQRKPARHCPGVKASDLVRPLSFCINNQFLPRSDGCIGVEFVPAADLFHCDVVFACDGPEIVTTAYLVGLLPAGTICRLNPLVQFGVLRRIVAAGRYQ